MEWVTVARARLHRSSFEFRVMSYLMLFLIFVFPVAICVTQKYAGFRVVPVPVRSDTLVVAVLTIVRYQYEIRYWAEHFVHEYWKHSYAESIGFWGEEPENWTEFRGIPYNGLKIDTNMDRSRFQLCGKLKAAMLNFLENTTANWFVRIVGDTAINFDTVHDMLRDANEAYNPLVDSVIQGACLGKLNVTYLQGGSGFLFSRKAIVDIIDDWIWVNKTCRAMKNDDRVLSAYLPRANITFRDATNRWFVGHRFANYTSAWEAVSAKKTKVCPRDLPKSRKGCRSYLTRVRDLAFWHDRTTFDDFIGKIDKIRRVAGQNTYFYVLNNRPLICVSDEDHSGYRDDD
jgi:hypothetical protein